MRSKTQGRWLPALKAAGESLDKVLRQCGDDRDFETSLAGKSVWRFRPTRLFWLLDTLDHCPVERMDEISDFLEAEINRLTDSLFLNHYSLEKLDCLRNHHVTRSRFKDVIPSLLERSKSIKPYKGRVSVPVVSDRCNSGVFPIASFAHFVEKPDNVAFPKETPAETDKIHALFSATWPESRNPEYALDLAQYVPVDGRSYELGYWVHSWLALHGWPAITSLCCTGIINNGNIDKVAHFEKKIESALAKGYEFCLVPAKNLANSAFASNPQVIGFNHVDELSIWLLEHTGTLPARRTIKNWLITNRAEPDEQIFFNFFDQMLEETGNPVILWKNTLGNNSYEYKCRKLNIICKCFSDFLSINGDKKQKNNKRQISAMRIFCPPDIFYSMLIEILLENCASSLPVADVIYKEFAESLLDSNLDVISASERLKIEHSEYYLQHRNFMLVRRRYPSAIRLLYRTQAEMLWLFSRFKELSAFEQKLFSALIEATEAKRNDLQDISVLRNAETEIMHEVRKVFANNSLMIDADLQPEAKQMSRLFEAKIEFANNGQTQAEKLCERLLFGKLELAVAKEDRAQELLNHLTSKAKIDGSAKEFGKIPLLWPLVKSILKYEKSDSKSDGSASATRNYYKINISEYRKACLALIRDLSEKRPGEQSTTIIWLPQPAMAIYRASNKWENILYQFCRSYPGTVYESQLLTSKCLAHWEGIRNGLAATEDAAPSLPRYNEYEIPYLAGWYTAKQQKMPNPCKRIDQQKCRLREILQEPKFKDFAGLFWIKTLPNNCARCLKPLINKLIRDCSFGDGHQGNAIPELQQKQFIGYNFARSLFSSKINAYWENALRIFLADPYRVRRTAQLLIPVYFAIKEPDRLDDALKKTWGMSNNSNFAVEYLRTFVFSTANNRWQYFRPLQWQMSIDRQMFHTICIWHMINSPETLQQFIIEKIDDFPNLCLALAHLRDPRIKT